MANLTGRQSTNIDDRRQDNFKNAVKNILTSARMAFPYSNDLPGAQSRAEAAGTKLFGYNMAKEIENVSDTTNHKLKNRY